jgi:hypothetical protein
MRRSSAGFAINATITARHNKDCVQDFSAMTRSPSIRPAVAASIAAALMVTVVCFGGWRWRAGRGEDKPTMARRRIKAAQAALTAEQYAVVETVAGWDALAGNSRRLAKLRDGLDELYRLWF